MSGHVYAMRIGRADLVILSNLTDEVTESLVDVDSLLGGRLNEFTPEVFRQVTTLCSMVVLAFKRQQGGLKHTIHSNLSLILKVTFICYNDDWEGVLVLYSEDLLVECADLLE